MTKVFLLLIFILNMNITLSQTFHDISIKGIDGELIEMKDFKEIRFLLSMLPRFADTHLSTLNYKHYTIPTPD